jgi:hypothetical protein
MCEWGIFKTPNWFVIFLKMGKKIHEGASGFLFGVGFLLATFE